MPQSKSGEAPRNCEAAIALDLQAFADGLFRHLRAPQVRDERTNWLPSESSMTANTPQGWRAGGASNVTPRSQSWR